MIHNCTFTAGTAESGKKQYHKQEVDYSALIAGSSQVINNNKESNHTYNYRQGVVTTISKFGTEITINVFSIAHNPILSHIVLFTNESKSVNIKKTNIFSSYV